MAPVLLFPVFRMALLGACLLALAPPAGADDDLLARDYPCVRTSGAASRFFQQVSGLTPVMDFLGERVAEGVLARELSDPDAEAGTRIRFRLRPFSGLDLAGARLRRFTFRGENLLLDSALPVTRLTVESDPETPVFLRRRGPGKNHRPVLLRPLRMTVRATVSEGDLNRLLASAKGRERLSRMKVTLPPFGPQYLDALSPSVSLKDGMLALQARMNIHDAPAENALPVALSARLGVDGKRTGRLALTDVAVQAEGIDDTRELARFVETYFGEIVDWTRFTFPGHEARLAVRHSAIADGALHLEGILLVAPDAKTLARLKPEGQ